MKEGKIKIFNRAEGAALLGFGIYFYFDQGFSIWWFLLLLLSIDLFMLGYLVNKRVGAYVYNLGHVLFLPILLLILGLVLDNRPMEGFAYIWIAHIGMDRLAGYGLKLTIGFKNTTLGNLSK